MSHSVRYPFRKPSVQGALSMVPVLIKLMVLRGNQVLNKFAKVMAIPEGKMKNKAGNANAGG